MWALARGQLLEVSFFRPLGVGGVYSQDRTQVGRLGSNCHYPWNHLPTQPMRTLIDWTLNIRTTIGGWDGSARQECLLVLQRTWIWVSEPRWQLTTTWNSCWLFWLHTYGVYTFMKVHTHSGKKISRSLTDKSFFKKS